MSEKISLDSSGKKNENLSFSFRPRQSLLPQ